MSAPTRWTGTEPLPQGHTVLLEASAGTGKTFQMAHLVTRLVAELDVSIERLLMITFTNAAVAELRKRVRQRLILARDALADDTPPADPLIHGLWQPAPLREARHGRLQEALRTFDLAPISTIHGFSQRMLDQLAFESDQEPGLELMADSSALIEQLVDDELARVLGAASAAELEVVLDLGWTRKRLNKVISSVAGAVPLLVEPVVEPDDDLPLTPLEAARHWRSEVQGLQEWLEGPEGAACIAALAAELALPSGKRRLKTMRKDTATTRVDQVKDWLAEGALASGAKAASTALKNLSVPHLESCWKEGSCESFEAFELFSRVTALQQLQERLWPRPLSALAQRARRHLDEELARKGVLTYATMLSRLAERVEEQGPEGPLARAMRARFDVALVDEFQDTDGAQWPVLRAVFSHPDRRLLVVGDPKQAIYAFRGADVHVYLHAATVAHRRYTMGTNWRSDGPLVQAMNHLWSEGSDAFELGEIDYVEVGVPGGHRQARIRGLPPVGDRPRRPLELRWLDGRGLGKDKLPISSKAQGADEVARRAAAEIARLLSTAVELQDDDGHWHPLAPRDIAVLVRTHRQARLVQGYLRALGVPSVSAGKSSVLQSPALDWVCAWLDAVAEPSRDRPARALATSPLFGWSAQQLAEALVAAEDPDAEQVEAWDRWRQAIQAWAEAYRRRGFFRVFEAALDAYQVLPRVLGAEQGERLATDLRLLMELAHAEERRARLGPAGLASWLRAARDDEGNNPDDTRAQRLETDDEAVQLVTIHTSKGLEYGIVLAPFCWADRGIKDKGQPLAWHRGSDDASDHTPRPRLSLHAQGTEVRDEAVRAAQRESRQEQLRLLYVALTRARHHALAWLGPIGSDACDADSYALGRLALRPRDAAGAPTGDGELPVFKVARPNCKEATQQKYARLNAEALEQVTERLDGLCQTSLVDGTPAVGWAVEPAALTAQAVPPQRTGATQATARVWPAERRLVGPWQVSSYSAMVGGRTFDASEPQRPDDVRAVTGGIDAEPREQGDDVVQVELVEPRAEHSLDAPLPSQALRGGTAVGTWVHAVFELLDFQQEQGPDGEDLATLVAAQGHRHGVRVPDQHALLTALVPSILDTPLDGGGSGLPEGYTLRALQRADRLDELGFDLRLGAGNRWKAGPDEASGRIDHEGARLALEARAQERGWGGELWLQALLERSAEEERAVLPRIAGVLTGFIDLTLRTEDGRFYVADYKTNRIAPPHRRRDVTLGNYTRPWLAWEMAHHGYHLQSLLYTVALHRLLRQRLPDYRYDTHVGGHLYLFLRGMVGPDTPRVDGAPLGVFHDRWPAEVVLGLDAALGGGPTERVRQLIDRVRDGGAP